MNAFQTRIVTIAAVVVAVIVAAWATMRVMDDRRDIAEANAAQATAAAEKAKALEEAERLAAIRAESEAKKAAQDAAKAKSDAEKAKLDGEKAKVDAQRALTEKAKAEAEAKTAAQLRAKADADARAAADTLAAEKQANARAQTEARSAEKLAAEKTRQADLEAATAQAKAERAKAEASVLEHRRMRLEELEQQLLIVKQDLDARELALRPELTIKDILTTSQEEEEEKPEGPVLAEDDPTIPKSSRKYARAQRLQAEQFADIETISRDAVVKRVEKLYVDAIKEDRIADADFYRKELKRMYPDWEYKPPEKEPDKKEGQE